VQNLYTRTITGVIFVALIIGSLILHPLAFVAIIYFIMLAGLLEFFNLAGNNEVSPNRPLGLVAGSIVFIIPALAALGIISPKFTVILPILIFILFVAELFRNKPNSLQNIAFSIFPIAYISIPLSILIFLVSSMVSNDQPHWHIAFSFFIILWSHDTFAYLTGMVIGKHKLFEKISPKKTWEGYFGGILVGVPLTKLFAYLFHLAAGPASSITPLKGALVGLVMAIIPTLGDLGESMIKRQMGVKDSGTILPGHGGAFDRIDAWLWAVLIGFYMVLWLWV